MAAPRFNVQFDQTRLRAFLRNLEAVRGNMRRAAAGALLAEAEAIMLESKRQVPVDLGNLRATGFVDTSDLTGSARLSVTLSYGGPAGSGGGTHVGYAVPVHENLQARHTVGKAKYLEDPVNDAISGMDRRLAARIRAAGFSI
jgi:hypothetical protein